MTEWLGLLVPGYIFKEPIKAKVDTQCMNNSLMKWVRALLCLCCILSPSLTYKIKG